MTITTTRFSGLGLALAGMVAAAALSAPPALAQGLAVTAPTHPTWARWLGIDSGQSFVLKGQAQAIEIGRSQSPVRVRVCVNAGTTPMSDNVDAKVMTDQGETIVPVGHRVHSRASTRPWRQAAGQGPV